MQVLSQSSKTLKENSIIRTLARCVHFLLLSRERRRRRLTSSALLQQRATLSIRNCSKKSEDCWRRRQADDDERKTSFRTLFLSRQYFNHSHRLADYSTPQESAGLNHTKILIFCQLVGVMCVMKELFRFADLSCTFHVNSHTLCLLALVERVHVHKQEMKTRKINLLRRHSSVDFLGRSRSIKTTVNWV